LKFIHAYIPTLPIEVKQLILKSHSPPGLLQINYDKYNTTFEMIKFKGIIPHRSLEPLCVKSNTNITYLLNSYMPQWCSGPMRLLVIPEIHGSHFPSVTDQ
jgi:hypothetical protein